MGKDSLEVAQEVIWMGSKSEFTLLMFRDMMEREGRKSVNKEH
jgi:hypothetical protein